MIKVVSFGSDSKCAVNIGKNKKSITGGIIFLIVYIIAGKGESFLKDTKKEISVAKNDRLKFLGIEKV